MMAGVHEDRDDAADVLTITSEARSTVLDVLAQEPESGSLALWLEVSGEANGAYAYDMYFQALSDADADDAVQADDTSARRGAGVEREPVTGRDARLRDRRRRAREASSS